MAPNIEEMDDEELLSYYEEINKLYLQKLNQKEGPDTSANWKRKLDEITDELKSRDLWEGEDA